MRLSAEYILDDLGDYMYLTGDTILFRKLCPPRIEICAGYINDVEAFQAKGSHLVAGKIEFKEVVAAKSNTSDLYYYEAVGTIDPGEYVKVDGTRIMNTGKPKKFLLKTNLRFSSGHWHFDAILFEPLDAQQ